MPVLTKATNIEVVHRGILLPQLPAGPASLNWGTVRGIVPANEKYMVFNNTLRVTSIPFRSTSMDVH